MDRILFGLVLAVAFGAVAAPANADDYRGVYWYSKYFGHDSQPYAPQPDEREGLTRGTIEISAFDQGYYNAHHLRVVRDRAQVYALARESQFDNEVAIVVDAKTGDVINAVVLPH